MEGQWTVRYQVVIIVDAPSDKVGNVDPAVARAVKAILRRICKYAEESPAIQELAEKHGIEVTRAWDPEGSQ